MSTLSVETRTLTFAQAVNEALAEELRRDETVFVIGEDVAEAGTPFKVLAGLVAEFGPERIVDSPISEAGITGLGVGAAMTGSAPGRGHHVRRLPHARDGPAREPGGEDALHVRRQAERPAHAADDDGRDAAVGRAAQPEPARVGGPRPGLKVVLPSTPADAKGLLKTAIRDDNPVVFIEDKMDYTVKGEVPDGEHLIPFGVADVKRAART